MPAINSSLCTIIIRSAGERTVPVLRSLLEEQVNSNQIFEVRETPLAKALEKCYQIGVKDNRKWILILDGDVLPTKKMISTLIEIFQGLDDRAFGLQCKVLDKMTCTFRFAGIHMHRTSLLQDAAHLIPQPHRTMRPESVTLDRMSKQGHPTLFVNNVLALHDYEQYYRDLFRKGYFLAHKSTENIPYLKMLWNKRAADKDYLVLLEGLKTGEQYDGLVTSNVEHFNRFDITGILSSLELEEKGKIDLSNLSFERIEKKLNNFTVPPEHWNHTLFSSNNSYQVSTKRRIIQLKEKLGVVKLIPWITGNYLEKVGKFLKDKMDN